MIETGFIIINVLPKGEIIGLLKKVARKSRSHNWKRLDGVAKGIKNKVASKIGNSGTKGLISQNSNNNNDNENNRQVMPSQDHKK